VNSFVDIFRTVYKVEKVSLLSKLQKFIELEGLSLLTSLMLAKLSFESCFFLFDKILRMENKFQMLCKAFLAVTYIN